MRKMFEPFPALHSIIIITKWFLTKHNKGMKKKRWNPICDSGWKKIFFIMRITVLFLFAGLLQVSASVYSQQTKLNLKTEKVSVTEILRMIEEQSNFHFLYRSDYLSGVPDVSIDLKDSKLEDVLNKIIVPYGFIYEIEDSTVIIKRSNSSLAINPADQKKEISGVVKDPKGFPLPGVSVVVKGTTKGVVTDTEGKFEISVPNDAKSLVFSFIGMKTQEIAITSKTSFNVVFKEETFGLDEVVAVGYGTMKKSDLVGSVSSISEKELKDLPTSNVAQLMQGQLSGLTVQSTTGGPNPSITIRIRGANSLVGGNDPLIVIDGMQDGDLNSLNPADIENIEALKDASATAIYGAKGANGVIIVTTKKGSDSKAKISYNGYYGVEHVIRELPLMNAYDYATTVNANRFELYPSGGANQIFTQAQLDGFKTKSTNWQNEIFRSAPVQSHQISIRGGNAITNYFVSGSYSDNQGTILNTSFKKYSLRSNLESQVTDKLTVGINLFLTRSQDHPTSLNNWTTSPTYAAYLFAPTLPVYQPNGSYSQPINAAGYGPPTGYNPVALALEATNDNLATQGEANTFLEYKIIKGLTAKVIGVARYHDFENSSFTTSSYYQNAMNQASITNSKDMYLQNTDQINYQRKFGEHDFNALAAYEVTNHSDNGDAISAGNFLTNNVSYHNLGLGANIGKPTSYLTKSTVESYFARLNYSYKSRYLLTLTDRYDGSSVFSEHHKWGFFPSGAAGWRVSEENFMKNISQISNLKLRASYGLTGNQSVGAYTTLPMLNTAAGYNISGDGSTLAPGVIIGTPGNPNLKWESTAQFNTGLDVGLFKGKINFVADYYQKKTTNLLMNVPLPEASGYSTLLENVGEVDNKGFEFDLKVHPFNGKFQWTTDFNISINRNKVVKLSTGVNEIDLGGTMPNFGSNTIVLAVGHPMGSYKGYIQDGTWGTAEAAQAATYGTIPGAPKLRDINHDGKIDTNDITFMGSAQPKFTWGWNNSFTYGGFNLSILLQGSYKNDVYNMSRVRSENTNGDADATSVRILDRWTPTHQNTNIPSFTGAVGQNLQTNRWMEDGTYLRFKNITLGYNLPKSLMNKAKIGSCRVYVSLVNFFTITKYTGFDPEATDVYNSADTYAGWDISTYPVSKSITYGINVTF